MLEGPSEHAQEALQIVNHCMTKTFRRDLGVDLVADGKIAQTWYEAK
jgi:DNA polymerase I-like protein with 3'-5' exonuclease and polymerase domains